MQINSKTKKTVTMARKAMATLMLVLLFSVSIWPEPANAVQPDSIFYQLDNDGFDWYGSANFNAHHVVNENQNLEHQAQHILQQRHHNNPNIQANTIVAQEALMEAIEQQHDEINPVGNNVNYDVGIELDVPVMIARQGQGNNIECAAANHLMVRGIARLNDLQNLHNLNHQNHQTYEVQHVVQQNQNLPWHLCQ